MKHLLAGAAALALAVSAGTASAQMSVVDIDKKLTQQYGVKVLRLTQGEYDGKKVFLATVMNPAGNSNGAFEVATLAVDPQTGNLIPAFRHTKTGYELSGAESTNTNRNDWGVPGSGRTWR